MSLDIIKDIGSYTGAVVTVIGFVVMIVKPLRERFTKWVSKITNKEIVEKKLDDLTKLVEKSIEQNETLERQLNTQNEALKATIRNSILVIYYTQTSKGYMTTFDLSNLTELYDSYLALGGNSFVKKCVEQLMKLPIKNYGGEEI